MYQIFYLLTISSHYQLFLFILILYFALLNTSNSTPRRLKIYCKTFQFCNFETGKKSFFIFSKSAFWSSFFAISANFCPKKNIFVTFSCKTTSVWVYFATFYFIYGKNLPPNWVFFLIAASYRLGLLISFVVIKFKT